MLFRKEEDLLFVNNMGEFLTFVDGCKILFSFKNCVNKNTDNFLDLQHRYDFFLKIFSSTKKLDPLSTLSVDTSFYKNSLVSMDSLRVLFYPPTLSWKIFRTRAVNM